MTKRPTIDVLTLKDADGQQYVDLQLRGPELEAIGRVATSWSFLDLMIATQSRGLASALGLDDPPAEIDAVAFKKRRMEWVRLAKEYCAVEQYASFRLLSEKASALARKRNGIIHDIMSIHPSNKNLLRALPIPDRGKVGRPLDVDQINRLALDIAKLSHSVLVFFGEPGTLPDASQRRRDTPGQSRHRQARGSQGRPPTKGQ